MYAVVESGHLHRLSKTAVKRVFCAIHALSDGSGRVQLVTESLQLFGYLPAFLAPLFRNFITNRPHHNTRVVAMVQHQVGDILQRPFLEETRITVLALGINPHIKALCHHHHTHRVANLHLPRRRHVMSRTDSVATHLLQHTNLSDEGSLVDGSAQRTQVVMQTNTLQFPCLSVQLETAFTRHPDCADTYFLLFLVQRLPVLSNPCSQRI